MTVHDTEILRTLSGLYERWNDPVDGLDVDRFLAEALATVRRADTPHSSDLREQLRTAFWWHQDRVDGFAFDAFVDHAVRIIAAHLPDPAPTPDASDWRAEPQVIQLFSTLAQIFTDPEIGDRAREITTLGDERLTVDALYADALNVAGDRGLGPHPLPESYVIAARSGVDATLAVIPALLGSHA